MHLMRKQRDTDKPTWLDIKRYVEGQLHHERRRLEGKVETQIDAVKRNAQEQFAVLEEQIEIVAREAGKQRADTER